MALQWKLKRDPDLHERYDTAHTEMEENQVTEEVPTNEVQSALHTYLPHQSVVKELSSTTEVQLVFDALVKGYNGVLHNDCLMTGPNLLPDLVSILARFQRWKIALSVDVTKAFLQISVHR